MAMTPTDVRNEQIKLRANWLNTMATAVMAAGGLGPTASFIYGILPGAVNPLLVFISSLVCFIVALGLHILGQWVLRGLR